MSQRFCPRYFIKSNSKYNLLELELFRYQEQIIRGGKSIVTGKEEQLFL